MQAVGPPRMVLSPLVGRKQPKGNGWADIMRGSLRFRGVISLRASFCTLARPSACGNSRELGNEAGGKEFKKSLHFTLKAM